MHFARRIATQTLYIVALLQHTVVKIVRGLLSCRGTKDNASTSSSLAIEWLVERVNVDAD